MMWTYFYMKYIICSVGGFCQQWRTGLLVIASASSRRNGHKIQGEVGNSGGSICRFWVFQKGRHRLILLCVGKYDFLNAVLSYPVGWSSNASGLYFKSTWFEFGPENVLPWIKFFVDFLFPSKHMSGWDPRTGPWSLLSISLPVHYSLSSERIPRVSYSEHCSVICR